MSARYGVRLWYDGAARGWFFVDPSSGGYRPYSMIQNCYPPVDPPAPPAPDGPPSPDNPPSPDDPQPMPVPPPS
jgi:hypothetical protein